MGGCLAQQTMWRTIPFRDVKEGNPESVIHLHGLEFKLGIATRFACHRLSSRLVGMETAFHT